MCGTVSFDPRNFVRTSKESQLTTAAVRERSRECVPSLRHRRRVGVHPMSAAVSDGLRHVRKQSKQWRCLHSSSLF